MGKKKMTGIISGPVPIPAAVSLSTLCNHFKETYGLSPAQVEVMVESSSRSLMQAFSQATAAMNTADPRQELAVVFHGLKGLLLNMGESDWAAYARETEQRLKKGEPCDYTRVLEELQDGMSAILFNCRDQVGKKPEKE